MAKELVFKVVMQGDTNNFDTSVKKSKQTAEQMFQAIGTAVEELEKKTKKSSPAKKLNHACKANKRSACKLNQTANPWAERWSQSPRKRSTMLWNCSLCTQPNMAKASASRRGS